MRLQAQIDQLRVFCVVVVLLRLYARSGMWSISTATPSFLAAGLHQMRQFEDGKLFRELIIDTAFASGCRVVAGDLDAAHGIADIEETARLTALAVDSERLPNGRLHAETIQDRAEDVVVVEAIDERFIERGFVVIVP